MTAPNPETSDAVWCAGRRLAASLLLALLLAVTTAAGQGRDLRPPATSRGALFVYLHPLGSDASRLRFRIDSLAAISEDGLRVPLSVDLATVDLEEAHRPRRLASGPIAPARYSGLALVVTDATIGGQAAVLPEGPVEVPLPFQVENGRAVVLQLRLDARGSVQEGFRFAPRLEARPAVPPPVARLAVVSSPGSAGVFVYDRVTLEVVGFMGTGRSPSGIALDTGRNRAYVAVEGDDAIVALGLLELRSVEHLRMQGGDEPAELALTPDGRTLLTANSGSRTVSFVDALSLVETDRLAVGDRPRAVILDPRGQRAYVFNTADSSLSVIDVARHEVIGAIATDSEPFRGQFNRAGDVLYVIHRRSPYLTLIDPATLAVTRKILLGTPATALKVDSRSDLLYVAPRGAGVIDVYDPFTLLPIESLPAEEDLSFLAIDEDDRQLHAGFPELGEIGVYPLIGKKIARTLDLRADSYWISVVGER